MEIPIFLIYFDINFEIVYLNLEPAYKYFFFRMAKVHRQVSTDRFPRTGFHGQSPSQFISEHYYGMVYKIVHFAWERNCSLFRNHTYSTFFEPFNPFKNLEIIRLEQKNQLLCTFTIQNCTKRFISCLLTDEWLEIVLSVWFRNTEKSLSQAKCTILHLYEHPVVCGKGGKIVG